MFSDTTLILINVACIGFLISMLAIMAGATRMRGGAGWAALIIVTTTVPVYLLNLVRDLSSAQNYLPAVYVASVLNVQCIPSLWFFVRSQLDRSFRFTARDLFHLIPSLASVGAYLFHYAPMSIAEVEANMDFMKNGGEDLPSLVNDLIVTLQLVTYFPLMLSYIHRRKKFLKNNYADSDYITVRWVYGFIAVFFGLFVIVLTAYAINPRTDVWLIPILNVIAMGYLVYSVIFHSTAPYLARLPEAPAPERESAAPAMSGSQMREICDKVTEYLQNSKAYINPDLTIQSLSVGTGIQQRNISAAINGCLRKNFFDLVNEMRIGEAKRRLPELNAEYTTDSVYPECGFRSRSAFFAAFRKFTGTTPTRWLNKQA